MSLQPRRKNQQLSIAEDRAQWLNYNTPIGSEKILGKKRFEVHKNISSYRFRETGQSVVQTTKNPVLIKETDKIEVSKGEDINRYSKKIAELENELKQKKEKIIVLENMYDLANRKEKISPKISRDTLARSFVDDTKYNAVEEIKNLRTSSLPSVKEIDPYKLINHPAFAQPKYTKSKPKIILSNPITGIAAFG